ncbi:hypothetical protein BD779DRAFT_1491842 [Infundibulicybe gibba]|nr:hypothetical protein BD779DRAFT_1491842 [Infundibulicybe gibba]
MVFKPQYTQPFTLIEAIALDVSVITEEIARLQNSLSHLKSTQEMLREYIESEPQGESDPEVAKAIQENEIVIGSQSERIEILRMALVEKGIPASGHYNTEHDVSTNESSRAQPTSALVHHELEATVPVDDGIHL